MKRMLAAILALMLCLGLCACGGDESRRSDSNEVEAKVYDYTGTYHCLGTYNSDGVVEDYDDNLENNAFIILEEGTVAKICIDPESGSGFTFWYEITGDELHLVSDFDLDGNPDEGSEAEEFYGTIDQEGCIDIDMGWGKGFYVRGFDYE